MKYFIRYSFTLIVALASLGISQHVLAQGGAATVLGQDDTRRVITTAVPFLAISPDSRASGMGDVGVATTPDANATHWNPAKLAFLEPSFGVSASFTPWLSKVVNDMSISYLSAYKKINQQQALGLSMRYFDLGDIQLTDQQGGLLNLVSPREFSLAATFALQLGENLSAGLTGRFIHSNLLSNTGSNGTEGQAGISGAADLGVYYTKDVVFNGNEGNWAFGANLSNVGARITYLDENQADFIPTNLRLGGAFTTYLDPYNKLTFAVDFNKLLVPTTPIYLRDSITDRVIVNANNDPIIAPGGGKDPDRPFLSAMFGSFADAPDGFSEELREVMISAGVEYWYNNLFAVRTGYFYEHESKGNRKYFTAGLGLRYQVFGVDFAYLLPQDQNHPLQETLRISLHFNIDATPTETIGEESDLN
ncbi:type IX secretion system outer membrane channel protein PorV [Tunicatimonas pelagia]|uniref:type IX secretion system outer membrane channel protein PorV n=1 Tax=Tunicatimonas pelagia TaxID=931531 RepID=UPI002664F40A|nr:type IX secretion system outer membrane channel protein PorV [Tunicatimonas pelagia]WKN43972.1 type IX secretion system outer membrane channel protein PorV [Tunicatimonas pelagia]